LQVKQDMRLRQTFQKGHQLGQRFHAGTFMVGLFWQISCQGAAVLSYLAVSLMPVWF